MIALALLGIAVVAPARRIVVAPNSPVPTVALALSQAADGDTIMVLAGYYPEANLVVARRVTLLGQGGPVLDGGGHPILILKADGITVQGLVLQNVGASFLEDRAAIRIDSVGHCLIADNLLRNTFWAIYAARAHDCTIRHNRILGNGGSETANANAIHLFASRRFLVEGNDVRGHRDGIYLEFSRHIVLRDNTSTGNTRYGLHFMYSDSCAYRGNVLRANRAGVAVMYANHVEMTQNTFADATGSAAYGLLLKEIRDSRLEGNHFTGNTVALLVEGSDRLVASANVFAHNGWAVRLYTNTEGGLFERNQFRGNAFDVVTNSRQSQTRFQHNFWDRYRGYDLDGDGVGDIPFRPVRLFGLIVEQHPATVLLLHSLFVTLLETAERIVPVLTPDTPIDTAPLMRWSP